MSLENSPYSGEASGSVGSWWAAFVIDETRLKAKLPPAESPVRRRGELASLSGFAAAIDAQRARAMHHEQEESSCYRDVLQKLDQLQLIRQVAVEADSGKD
jgi:hypothetical protein